MKLQTCAIYTATALVAIAFTLIGCATNTGIEPDIKTKAEIETYFGAALVVYRIDMGAYPSTDEGLSALLNPPNQNKEKWKGPYINKPPKDRLGNAYQYAFPGKKNINGPRGYDLWSLGPDGIPSHDDITNWTN